MTALSLSPRCACHSPWPVAAKDARVAIVGYPLVGFPIVDLPIVGNPDPNPPGRHRR